MSELQNLVFLDGETLLRLLVVLLGVFVRRLNFRARRFDRRFKLLFDLVEGLAGFNHLGVFFLVAFFESRNNNLLCRFVGDELCDRRNFGDERKRAKILGVALVFAHQVPLGRHRVEQAFVVCQNRVDVAQLVAVYVVDLVERNRAVDFSVFYELFVELLNLRLLLRNLCTQLVD